jgi:molybdopterin synthase sulfur carrier subunit
VTAAPDDPQACASFACEEDLSHTSYDAPLPEPVLQGREPFVVIGAMAGG